MRFKGMILIFFELIYEYFFIVVYCQFFKESYCNYDYDDVENLYFYLNLIKVFEFGIDV